MYNEKSKERTIRYMKEKRDKLTLNLPLGNKERYKEHAKRKRMSLTGLIVDLLEQDIKNTNADTSKPEPAEQTVEPIQEQEKNEHAGN